MLTAGSLSVLPAECFDDPAQQNQVTLAGGYYRFDLNFADPACPSGGNYLIDVTPPPTGYIGTYSQIIPPTSSASTSAFSVPSCSGGIDDALTGTPDYCEVQTSEFAPTLAVRARSAGTRYHAHLTLDNSLVPGSSQIYNNHIPVDPDLQGALQISKTTPMLNVMRGQLVPYVITYKNVTDVPLFDVSIVDRIPAGFRYVEGSARIDRVPVEPAVAGRELIWSDLAVDRQEQHELLVLLAVGAGVSEGEFVNRVQAVHMLTGSALSNEASATVRVVPDPTFDCTDVTGKVFDDANRNGHQDLGETGLPGVRVVSARGLTATTDAYGRFHITCAVVPREGRGSNFVLKLDDRTLPSGFRSSTDQVKIERATRGKALKFNFGASLHRVIGLDLADAVFEPGTTEMRAQWRPRLDMLMKELQKAPAILRLSYLADVENEQLVQRRLEAIKSEIASRWQSQNANATYQLTIEPEVFWRLGAPPQHAVGDRSGEQVTAMSKHRYLWLLISALFPLAAQTQDVVESPRGETVERNLPTDEPLRPWAHDPNLLQKESGDRVELRPVHAERLATVKLTDVVPPIRFDSGLADIPQSYIESLRKALDDLRDRRNVRLHLVGHADDQPLSDELARRLRRQRGPVARARRRSRRIPADAPGAARRGDLL